MESHTPRADESGPRSGFPLSQADIDEFREIVLEEFALEMDNSQAWRSVNELLSLYRSLLGAVAEDPEPHKGISHVIDSLPPRWGKRDALD
jgi:hypothetical protein